MKRYRITSFFNGHHIVLSLRKLFLDLRSVRYRICDARILVYHALYAFKSDVKKVIGLCASLISRLQNRAICSINLRAQKRREFILANLVAYRKTPHWSRVEGASRKSKQSIYLLTRKDKCLSLRFWRTLDTLWNSWKQEFFLIITICIRGARYQHYSVILSSVIRSKTRIER